MYDQVIKRKEKFIKRQALAAPSHIITDDVLPPRMIQTLSFTLSPSSALRLSPARCRAVNSRLSHCKNPGLPGLSLGRGRTRRFHLLRSHAWDGNWLGCLARFGVNTRAP